MQDFQSLGRQKGFMVPRVSGVEHGNCHNFLYRVFALRERRNTQNAEFCEQSFGKNRALYVHLMYTKMSIFFGTGRFTNCIA